MSDLDTHQVQVGHEISNCDRHFQVGHHPKPFLCLKLHKYFHQLRKKSRACRAALTILSDASEKPVRREKNPRVNAKSLISISHSNFQI